MARSNELETNLNEDLDYILRRASKDQVARCARLLGAYLALYKHYFGELTEEQYRTINAAAIDGDAFGQDIFSTGCKEVLDMLALVALQELERESTVSSSSIN